MHVPIMTAAAHCRCEHAYLGLLFGLMMFTIYSLIDSWMHPETLKSGNHNMDVDEPVLVAVLVLPVVCVCLYECAPEVEMGHSDSAFDVRARMKASMHAVLATIRKPGKTMMNRFNDRGKRKAGRRPNRENNMQV